MSRIGLQRHRGGGEPADDPLDGLVNLFDLGLVLAVAFLVAGLSIGGAARSSASSATSTSPRASGERELTVPSTPTSQRGAGVEVGKVYRLPDGTLVLADDTKGASR